MIGLYSFHVDRVSVSPSGIFSSRELEMEMRTLLLKRMAFTLFCTDGDQYQRFLPDIQGRSQLNFSFFFNEKSGRVINSYFLLLFKHIFQKNCLKVFDLPSLGQVFRPRFSCVSVFYC